ncbi:MAG: FtsQ-type POTRA domain-containing protein [Peptococcaceae bacterium]|nr:FtsQ-type POTRA domain-containing protein [Peptococcaceae bacterium]MDH7524352.1 FtsQ-type POTRA domain-containing protein [Peptococcaceae bacterium]
MHSAVFSVKAVDVKGNSFLSAEEIVELSGIRTGVNIFKLDTREAAAKMKVHPRIKNVEIKRKLPHKILLQVTERYACAYLEGQGGLIAVDEEGVYLYKENDPENRKFALISGVPVNDSAGPGADLSTPGLASALLLLKLLDKAILADVEEIVAPTPESLVLKTRHGVEVRFGRPEELERKVMLIGELLVKNGELINDQTVEYIDLRYNTAPVIKRKN